MGRFGFIALWARVRHSPAGVLATLMLAMVAYPALSGTANSPVTDAELVAPRSMAALTRDGDDLIITGSVANLFNSGFFAGPNRGEKVNRARLTPDGVTVSDGFEEVRQQIAEARGLKMPAPANEAPIAVAAISPVDSAALGHQLRALGSLRPSSEHHVGA